MVAFSLGIDSSNYRSSVAALYADGRNISRRELLPVEQGLCGLRQSDAVFAHTRQLPLLIEEIFGQCSGTTLSCIGFSDRPRRVEGSYMPCFLVGSGLARAIAAANRVPLFAFSHQEGHIAAALLSADRMDLFHTPCIAFHVSGGTTEAVLVEPDANGVWTTTILAKSLDLHFGQLIDRTGVMLGLPFPAGEGLEQIAAQGKNVLHLRPCVKGMDCAISGAQNLLEALHQKGEVPENIAASVQEFISDTLCLMLQRVNSAYPGVPVVFSGGVMANQTIRRALSAVAPVNFATPALSGDNAVGIALLAQKMLER